MTIYQYPRGLNQLIDLALKADEKIVCRNATVIMDGKENLSYFNNNSMVGVIDTED